MRSFDKADKYRTPVIILGDAILGQMMEPFEPTPYTRPDLPGKQWALTGCRGRQPNVVKSLFMGEGELEQRNNMLQAKYSKMKSEETMFQTFFADDAELIVVAFGIAARIALASLRKLRQEGH